MKRKTNYYLLLPALWLASLLTHVQAEAQTTTSCDYRATYLYWVGGASTDFFDERNWREASRKIDAPEDGSGSGPGCLPGILPKFVICRGNYDPDADKIPKAGTLEPGQPIPFNLLIDSATVTINGTLLFSCIDKGINLNAATLVSNTAIAGTVHLYNNSTFRFGGSQYSAGMRISLMDHGSWVYFNQLNPLALDALPLNTWLINLQTPAGKDALLFNQYYQTGAIVRRNPPGSQPLTVYSGADFSGNKARVGVDTIFKGSAIPGGLDHDTRSFKLKRGFILTVAVNTNGTGKSKVYIASEKDLEITDLPTALSGNIRFLRVLPFNWVTKKGTGGYFANNPLNAGWFYSWSATQNTQLNYEYVPMTWGAGATSPASLMDIIDKEKVNQILGFNESDNCSGESGQFLNLCQPDVAVAYYERLMGTGMRLGTPAPRENGPSTWLRQFAASAKARDVRFDFVAVHWYDWGSNPAGSPNADATIIFNRFKTYLQNVHDEYQLPIWITEFNANPNRGNATQQAFLQLALPYLESLPYVERYAYFQPNPNNASSPTTSAYYFVNKDDPSWGLTNIGQLYRDQSSGPSIVGDTYDCPNNLDGLDAPLPTKQAQQFAFEAECGKYPGSQWTVNEDATASNHKYLQGNNQLTGTTDLATQVHFDIDITEANNFRLWLRSRSGSGVAVIQVDHDRTDTIRSIVNSEFAWQSIPRLYSFEPGKHRISLAFANNSTQFDQLVLKAGSDDVDSPLQPAGSCEPEAFIWGLEAPDAPAFIEAESADAGANWTVEPNDDAIGGAFAGSGSNTSVGAPPAADGLLTFTVNVSHAAAYQFWAKVQALEPTSNQLWMKIDDGDFAPWTGLQSPGFLWKWNRYDITTAGGLQQEYLFLEPGIHHFTIGYASGGVKIDRAVLIAAESSPTAIDPDVLLPVGVQSFEAEEAELVGAAAIVNCATSSNGQQVNLLTAGTNGVRFNKVLAGAAGTYQLAIQYMTNGVRSTRVFVNGVQQPNQRMATSGEWCFNNGSPATWYMTVPLLPGENSIEFRPIAGTNSPFIDRIDVQPSLVSLEAELASLTGSVATPGCSLASNGMLANMGNTGTNAIQFNDISIPETGDYQLDITYYSKNARSLTIKVDDEAFTTVNFEATGNWCFESAPNSPAIKPYSISLLAGVHSIRFQPVSGSESPILDKIDLVKVLPEPAVAAIEKENTVNAAIKTAVTTQSSWVFPNPARPGAVVYLPRHADNIQQPVQISLLNAAGAVLRKNVQAVNAGYHLPNVAPGMYLIRVEQPGKTGMYKLLIN